MTFQRFALNVWLALIDVGRTSEFGWVVVWMAVSVACMFMYVALETLFRLCVHFVRVWRRAQQATARPTLSQATDEHTRTVIASYYPQMSLRTPAKKGFQRGHQSTVVDLTARKRGR